MSFDEPTTLDRMRRLLKTAPEVGGTYAPVVSAGAALLITNFTAWWAASQGKRRTWVLYRIDTLTPGYYYFGISSKLVERAYSHLRGATPFTAKYGMRSMTVLAMLSSREEAERIEWRIWLAHRNKDGAARVGGYSDRTVYSGLGLA